jgi:hypothetical protein
MAKGQENGITTLMGLKDYVLTKVEITLGD